MEIAEEEEDEQRAIKRQTLDDATESPPKTPTEPVKLDADLASSPEHSKFAGETTSDVPTFVGVDITKDADNGDADGAQFDALSYSGYSYAKPKIKLGPRPSADVGSRPHTAGNFRPVSAIPSGFKLFGKGSKKTKGGDAASISSPQEEIDGLGFSPSSASLADDASSRPATSSGIVLDPPVQLGATKKQTLSPEKVRLMKAMKLREKKKKLSMLPPPVPTIAVPTETSDINAEIETGNPDVAEKTESGDIDKALPRQDEDQDGTQLSRDSVDKDDSGLGTDLSSSSPQADQTFDQLSVSHPTNSVVASSDAEPSTKASSISESTDETVHPKEEEDVPAKDATAKDASSPDETASKDDVPEAQAAPDFHPAAALETAPENNKNEVAEEVPPVTAAVTENPSHEAENGTAETFESSATAEEPEVESPQDNGRRSSLEGLPVPVSKFSPKDPSSPVDATTPLEEAVPDAATEDNEPEATGQPTVVSAPAEPVAAVELAPTGDKDVEPVKDENVSETEPGAESKSEEQKMDKKLKRRAHIEPLTTDMVFTDRPTSDVTIRAAESAADQETELEETKSTAGDETPISANSSGKSSLHAVRTVSNPTRGNLVTPTDASQSSARSLSSGAAYLHKITQRQASGNLAKKGNNIGSSISQRIKALEKFSATATTGDAPAATSRDRPSSTFFAVQKREPSRAPSVIERANSLRNPTPETPHDVSQESSPEGKARPRMGRSGSVTKRMSMFESPPGSRSIGLGAAGGAPIPFHGRPESVSVTARIVRDPDQDAPARFEAPQNPSEYTPLDLKQSPLLVDHQVASSPSRLPLNVAVPGTSESNSPDQNTDRGSDAGKSHKSRNSTSLGIVRGFMKERRKSVASTSDAINIAGSPPKSAEPSPPSVLSPRLSISSPRSSFSRDRDVIISPSESGSGDDARSTNGDKKLSRTGRFMRRLSNLSSSRGKPIPSTMSSSITEEDGAAGAQKQSLPTPAPTPSRPSTTGSPAIVAYMGDVNVQFPDNLLWKRRNMTLDSQGFLILSALQAQHGRPAQGTKRYHLGDFRPPYIPDVEVQELPNSVVLDFVDGSGIQVACEDRAGQLRILESMSIPFPR